MLSLNVYEVTLLMHLAINIGLNSSLSSTPIAHVVHRYLSLVTYNDNMRYYSSSTLISRARVFQFTHTRYMKLLDAENIKSYFADNQANDADGKANEADAHKVTMLTGKATAA